MGRPFGAMLFFNASQLSFIQSAGTVAYTRNAAGDISINLSASSTAQVHLGFNDIKRPYITFPAFPGQGTVVTSNEFQAAFGTAAGGPGNPISGGGTVSASVFGTPNTPYGISIVDVFAVYSVVTNPLSTATIGLYRQRYAEGVANAQDVLVNAVALATTATGGATTCHVQSSALAQPLSFEAINFSDLVGELVLTTPAGGTARVYGMGVHVVADYTS